MNEDQKKLLYLFQKPFEPLNFPRKDGEMLCEIEGEEAGDYYFQFTTKPDGNNYADCDGKYIYAPDRGTYNGKPVYVNESKDRVLAVNPNDSWIITNLSKYQQTLKDKEGQKVRGFHECGKGEPHLGDWKNYDVEKIKESTRRTATRFCLPVMSSSRQIVANCRIPFMPNVLDQLNMSKTVKKGVPFSQFNPLHIEAARELTRIFMGVKNVQELVNVAANIKNANINEGLFIYALSFAIIRNPDLDSRMVPPIYEVFPNKFVPQNTMDQISDQLKSRQYENKAGDYYFQFTTKPDGNNYADCDGKYIYAPDRGTYNGKPIYVNESKDRVLAANPNDSWIITNLSDYWEILKEQERQMISSSFHSGGKGEPHLGDWKNYDVEKKKEVVVEHDIFFTGSDHNPEHRVAYFREDYGLNSHHWHWHLIFPIGIEDEQRPDRKGELFFYMHNQMVARYDWERLSNHLNRVVKLNNWRKPIPEGYFSKLTINNSSKQYGSRPDNMTPQNFTRIDKIGDDFHPFDLNDMERWRHRIFDAIHQGFMIDTTGKQVSLSDDIPADQRRGIEILGDSVEADDKLSVNPAFYGALHNRGHDMIAFIHDPHGYHKEELGVIGDTSTACRDPAFWRWHKFIDDVFVEYKMQQKPYKDEELVFDTVKVESITVKTSNIDEGDNALETGWNHRTIEADRGLDFRAQDIDVKVKLQHLTHTPFTYNIEVSNCEPNPVDVTVRIYMAPKYNEAGKDMSFLEQRLLWAEMDRFHYLLKPELNPIKRSSEDSSVTIPEELTFRDLKKKPLDNATEFCGCGWPQHLLLPKGKKEGMDFQIFVLISDWKKDKVKDSAGKKTCSNASSFCGIQNSKYPDARPMGYPFDRTPDRKVNNKDTKNFADYAQALPNAHMSDIKIYFRDRCLKTPRSS